MLRRCIDCGLEAHSEEDLKLFCAAKGYKHSYRNLCKACRTGGARGAYNKRQHAAWFQKNKERELEKQRERRKELAYRIGCYMPGRKWVPISIKRALVERANGQCERKDSSCKGGLTIHHVDRDPENNELLNLELICMGHAAQEHETYILGLRARGIIA